jgi:hypothetical protein
MTPSSGSHVTRRIARCAAQSLAGLDQELLLGPIQKVLEIGNVELGRVVSTGGNDELSIGRERCSVHLVGMAGQRP